MIMEKCECGNDFFYSKHCAAWVCEECSSHKDLARCYCGWSESGQNGRRELEEMGETIEPEDY
jgi:hypothetical protein